MTSGSLETIANKADGSEQGERFLESFWERHLSEEQFRTAVMQSWVKLGMSEPYRPRGCGAVVALKSPGKWVLRSTCHPPVLTDAEKSIVESLGCSPPETLVQSEPVTITVTDSSQ
jgi:hypothetical protein